MRNTVRDCLEIPPGEGGAFPTTMSAMDRTTKRVLEVVLVTIISWALTKYLVRPGVQRLVGAFESHRLRT